MNAWSVSRTRGERQRQVPREGIVRQLKLAKPPQHPGLE
jgi:hypothetical protein